MPVYFLLPHVRQAPQAAGAAPGRVVDVEVVGVSQERLTPGAYRLFALEATRRLAASASTFDDDELREVVRADGTISADDPSAPLVAAMAEFAAAEDRFAGAEPGDERAIPIWHTGLGQGVGYELLTEPERRAARRAGAAALYGGLRGRRMTPVDMAASRPLLDRMTRVDPTLARSPAEMAEDALVFAALAYAMDGHAAGSDELVALLRALRDGDRDAAIAHFGRFRAAHPMGTDETLVGTAPLERRQPVEHGLVLAEPVAKAAEYLPHGLPALGPMTFDETQWTDAVEAAPRRRVWRVGVGLADAGADSAPADEPGPRYVRRKDFVRMLRQAVRDLPPAVPEDQFEPGVVPALILLPLPPYMFGQLRDARQSAPAQVDDEAWQLAERLHDGEFPADMNERQWNAAMDAARRDLEIVGATEPLYHLAVGRGEDAGRAAINGMVFDFGVMYDVAENTTPSIDKLIERLDVAQQSMDEVGAAAGLRDIARMAGEMYSAAHQPYRRDDGSSVTARVLVRDELRALRRTEGFPTVVRANAPLINAWVRDSLGALGRDAARTRAADDLDEMLTMLEEAGVDVAAHRAFLADATASTVVDRLPEAVSAAGPASPPRKAVKKTTVRKRRR